ncbi:hypothetical protein BamMEX5DRAFT_1150 [Burkholderia ambifaria MEX-5]|uniref:Uncharacterized protein n=1 Tax=Burkholderia ambifaria MEX-5 TaxID=396597 RepID=B1T034_9BURK|nr:hypothetical protein BamMEX5DRAFT_1150 [Burkholderia ambifaria MEX-5]
MRRGIGSTQIEQFGIEAGPIRDFVGGAYHEV